MELTTNQGGNQSAVSIYSDKTAFDEAQRMALCLSKSNLIPSAYQGAENIANCLVALELAHRTKNSVLSIMQNVHIIKGNPSFKSTFIISVIKTCGRFLNVRFVTGEKPMPQDLSKRFPNVKNLTCQLVVTDKATGDELKGMEISVEMAMREDWYSRSGSKWPTMTEQLLMYRAAAFFSRIYCSDILMGMRTDDETQDIVNETETVNAEVISSSPVSDPTSKAADLSAKAKGAKEKTKTVEVVTVEHVQVAEVVDYPHTETPPATDDDDFMGI